MALLYIVISPNLNVISKQHHKNQRDLEHYCFLSKVYTLNKGRQTGMHLIYLKRQTPRFPYDWLQVFNAPGHSKGITWEREREGIIQKFITQGVSIPVKTCVAFDLKQNLWVDIMLGSNRGGGGVSVLKI